MFPRLRNMPIPVRRARVAQAKPRAPTQRGNVLAALILAAGVVVWLAERAAA